MADPSQMFRGFKLSLEQPNNVRIPRHSRNVILKPIATINLISDWLNTKIGFFKYIEAIFHTSSSKTKS